MAGFFISLEGGEGGGKTTQNNRLCSWLQEQGYDVVQTREPGTTPGGLAIREILLRGDVDRWLPMSELLLFYAARHDSVERVIKPALAAGKVVVADRFIDSTLVYQGYGRGLPLETINTIRRAAIGDLMPDLTLIFDVDAKTALRRSEGKYKGEHRFEQIGEEFHARIQHGFHDVAAKNPDRCALIDAIQPLESVTAEMFGIVKTRLLKSAA
jgi:dTMP kinase